MKTILYFFTILSLLNCSKDKSVSADLAMIAEPMIAAKSANYNAPPPLAEIKLVDSAAVSVNESSPNSSNQQIKMLFPKKSSKMEI